MNLIISKLLFSRIIREIAIEKIKKVQFSRSIFKIIYKFAKTFIYYIFKNVNLYVIYIKRIIIIIKNI